MMKIAIWLYRLVAQAFPHEFKIIYGSDLTQLGEDAAKDIEKQFGFFGLVRMIADLAIRIPVEYLSEVRRDAKYALRSIAHSPGFSAVAIVSLSMGIGVASFMFSEVHSMIFRDLPLVKQPQGLASTEASYPYFEQYQKQSHSLSSAAVCMVAVPFNITLDSASGDKGLRIFGQIVSPEYFQVLGISAARGRVFNPIADHSGNAPAVIVTDRFWRQHLNSDPDVVGKTMRVNGQTATIIGVGPKDFLGVMPILACDLFVPTTAPPSIAPELADEILRANDVKAFIMLMRLAPGVSRASAEAELDAITKRLNASRLDPALEHKEPSLKLSPGGATVPAPPGIKAMLYSFCATLVGLILAIACMNLANMLLARTISRRREIAIRLAVGASRFRLVRQLLTESILLSIGGGALGMALACWMTNGISKLSFPGAALLQFDLQPDWQVGAFTFVLSLIVGIAFGLAPALAATAKGISLSLNEGGVAQMRGYKRFGIRNMIMVFQVSGSVMLLLITAAISFGGRALWTADASFDTRTMYLMSLDPLRDGYSPEQSAAFFEKLPDRIRRATAIDAALTIAAPFDSELSGLDISPAPASCPRAGGRQKSPAVLCRSSILKPREESVISLSLP
jgi:macrolide transport system ATP-binding/permease protein